MCVDPLSAGMFLVSAASSMASYAAKEQQANAQDEAYSRNYQNALAAGRDEQRQFTQRQLQEQEANAQKQHVSLVEQAQKEASVSVSAAGANVAGLSVDNLIADVQRTSAVNRSTMEKNWEMTAQQLQTEKEAGVNRTQSRINSVSPGSHPSPIGAALEIAGAGLKAYKG